MNNICLDRQYLEDGEVSGCGVEIEGTSGNLKNVVNALAGFRGFLSKVKEHSCSNLNCFKCFLGIVRRGEGDRGSEKIEYLVKYFKGSESATQIYDYICEKIHLGKSRKCKPLCFIHTDYPIFFENGICECGVTMKLIRNDLLFKFSIDVSKIKRNYVTDISYLLEPDIKFRESYINQSLIKHTLRKLPNFLTKILSESKILHECESKLNLSREIKSENFKFFCFSFDWSNISKNPLNSLFALSILTSSIDLSQIFDSSLKSTLNISSIIFEDASGNSLLVTSRDHSWCFYYNSIFYKIKTGTCHDLLFFMARNYLCPVLVFYDSYSSGYINWSPNIFAFLEFNSISIGIMNNYQYWIDNIENSLKDLALKMDLIRNICKSCKCEKRLTESCGNCGFIEGDWVCIKCGEDNEGDYWLCWSCNQLRIKFENENFYCDECRKISLDINYCLYCPLKSCFICEKEIFAFEKVYCEICSKFTSSFYDPDHGLIHYKCFNGLESLNNNFD